MRPDIFSKEVAKVKAKLGAGYRGVISQSFLRAEAETIDGNGTYIFDFKASKGSRAATEKLLADNDMFRVLAIRFFLLDSLTSNPTISVPQTYPNPLVFNDETDDGTPGTFVTNHLEAFYNAAFATYKKGDTTFLPALPLRDARFVAQTQQSSLVNKSSTELVAPGAIQLNQPFSILGVDQGELSVNVPSPSLLKIQYSTVANVTTTPRKVKLVMMLDGILFSGGSKISTAAQAMDLMSV